MKRDASGLHARVIDAANGSWGVFVQSVVAAENNEHLFLKIILEQSINDEQIEMRRLDMRVIASKLTTPEGCAELLAQVREWIKASEGDGYLDLGLNP